MRAVPATSTAGTGCNSTATTSWPVARARVGRAGRPVVSLSVRPRKFPASARLRWCRTLTDHRSGGIPRRRLSDLGVHGAPTPQLPPDEKIAPRSHVAIAAERQLMDGWAEAVGQPVGRSWYGWCDNGVGAFLDSPVHRAEPAPVRQAGDRFAARGCGRGLQGRRPWSLPLKDRLLLIAPGRVVPRYSPAPAVYETAVRKERFSGTLEAAASGAPATNRCSLGQVARATPSPTSSIPPAPFGFSARRCPSCQLGCPGPFGTGKLPSSISCRIAR